MMTIEIPLEERVGFLSRSSLFQGVDQEKLKLLAERMTPRQASAGKVLIREGTAGHEMFFLVKGRVKVTRCLTLMTRRGFTDREKSFNFLDSESGANFGEVALVSDLPRTATVSAQKECRLLVLSREDFERICSQDTELGYVLVGRICQQLAELLHKSNNDVLKLATALSLALTPS